MPFPCEIVPQSSRLLMAGLMAGHLALGAAFWCSSLPPPVIGVALAGLLISLFCSYRRWRGRTGLRFILKPEGGMLVVPPASPAYEARVDGNCRDLGWAVWLAWRCAEDPGAGGGQGGVLMLLRDALAPEIWRALRVWLRFRAGIVEAEARRS